MIREVKERLKVGKKGILNLRKVLKEKTISVKVRKAPTGKLSLL